MALQGLARGSRLVSVYFPLLLKPARAWSYNRLDLGVRLDSDGGGRRPKVVEILPPKRFADRLQTNGEVDLRLGGDGRFQVSTGDIDVQVGPAAATVGVGVDAHAAASFGFTAQPFTYRLRKTEIDHTQIGSENVYWELNGTEFFENNVPAFVLLAEVSHEAKELNLAAAMRVFRKFDSAGAPMIDAIKALPKALANFLKGGAPLETTGSWDIALRPAGAEAHG